MSSAPTSNIPCNTPVEVLVDALIAKGHAASWYYVYQRGTWSIHCDGIRREFDHHALEGCVELAYPFGKPLNGTALAITQLAMAGHRPAHPRYKISAYGQSVVEAMSRAAITHANLKGTQNEE